MSHNKNENSDRDIFEREKAGEVIRVDDPEFPKIREGINRAFKITSKINNHQEGDFEEIKRLFGELTQNDLDESFRMWPPFYTDFGQHIEIGKNVFINHGCTFMDRGGITLEDNVLIGPKVNLITTNHPLDPEERKKIMTTISKPILVKKNVWIGAAATVMPGVTIGENAVVAAGAVVSKDVPDNTVVAGVPAKVVKEL